MKLFIFSIFLLSSSGVFAAGQLNVDMSKVVTNENCELSVSDHVAFYGAPIVICTYKISAVENIFEGLDIKSISFTPENYFEAEYEVSVDAKASDQTIEFIFVDKEFVDPLTPQVYFSQIQNHFLNEQTTFSIFY